jgi:hypothetical protein
MAQKYTLLEMVQIILATSLDSDPVNTIGETIESAQVAQIVIDTYDEKYAKRDVQDREGLIKLTALADTTRPTHMLVPDDCEEIHWIKYNSKDVTYKPPSDFFRDALSYNTVSSTLPVNVSDFGSQFFIRTDIDPQFYTTLNNRMLIFDAFNQTDDSTLQNSKTFCWGRVSPVFALTDSAIPPFLSPDDFPGLLAEAKAVASMSLRQVPDQKAEQFSRRQRTRELNDLWRANQREYNSTVNFGRPKR